MNYEYTIRRADTMTPDWAHIPAAALDHFAWAGTGYRPESTAQMVFVPEKGFLVRMACRESDPAAACRYENEPVCIDSCLEIFGDFSGQGKGYLNCEINAHGVMLCEFGKTRTERFFLKDRGIERPQISVFSENGVWGWVLFIPLSLMDTLYGGIDTRPGAVYHGNFYKCGGPAEQEHYGMWQPVDTPEPDFHCPAQFGTWILE